MRLIDADRLLEDKRIEKYYHLKNGDIAIPLIDIKHAPTVEERTEERAGTHACDLISRQAAIDALADMYRDAEKWGQEADDDVIKARAESCMASLVEMKLRIEKLPPAQPGNHK